MSMTLVGITAWRDFSVTNAVVSYRQLYKLSLLGTPVEPTRRPTSFFFLERCEGKITDHRFSLRCSCGTVI